MKKLLSITLIVLAITILFSGCVKKANEKQSNEIEINSNLSEKTCQIIGSWKFQFASDNQTSNSIKPKSYIHAIIFYDDGTAQLTFRLDGEYGDKYEFADATWKFHDSSNGTDVYNIKTNNTEIGVALFKTDGKSILSVLGDTYICYYEKG